MECKSLVAGERGAGLLTVRCHFLRVLLPGSETKAEYVCLVKPPCLEGRSCRRVELAGLGLDGSQSESFLLEERTSSTRKCGTRKASSPPGSLGGFFVGSGHRLFLCRSRSAGWIRALEKDVAYRRRGKARACAIGTTCGHRSIARGRPCTLPPPRQRPRPSGGDRARWG